MDGKIVIKKQTNYQGKLLLSGDRITVPLKIEERWIRNGIAQYVPSLEKPTIKSFEKSSLDVKVEKNKPTSIIIPACGCLDFLRNCIDSIVRHTNNYEIIVIDNATPNTPISKHIDILNDFDLTIVTNKKNMGFGYACNQGIKIAKYDYICFLNSDTLVTPNWLHKLQKCFTKVKDKVSFASPTTCHSRGRQCDKALFRKAHVMTHTDIMAYTNRLEEGYEQTEIYGFCMLAKKELFKKVGVFDYKRYGLGNCEETDLQWRAEQSGYKSWWVKGAYVHHYGHETFKRLEIETNLRFNENVFAERKKDKNLFIENDVIVDDVIKVGKPKLKKTIDSVKIGFVPHHNIHALCFRISAGTRIRVLNIVKHLKNSIVSYNFNDLKECQAVIFQAKWADSDVILAKKLKEHGVKLFFDTTDPHWDINFDPNGRHKKALERLIRYVDVMILPTELLKESFLKYRQDIRVEVLPDSIDLSKHTKTKKHTKKDKYTIVWFGCRSNVCQVDTAREDLEKLGKEFDIKLIAVFDKYFKEKIKPFNNIKLETRDWTDDETIKAILESDVAINPRYDDWKKYKSRNKTIKVLALGVPCVERDFYKEIKKYLLSASLRNKDGKKGKETAKEFGSKRIAKRLVDLCSVKKPDIIKKKKIAVITAIAGGFDHLHDPEHYENNVDYFAYIDSDEKSDIWDVTKIEYTHFKQPRMTAKIYKILTHRYCDYDYTVWIDGSIGIRGSVTEMVDKFLKDADMALFKHKMRNCVYEEHIASLGNKRHGTGEPNSIREKRTARYKAEGLPAKSGLYECTIILRKNNAKIRNFNRQWWEEVSAHSSSDQIAFMYCLWKNPGIKVATITPGNNHDSKWLYYIEHGQK